MSLDTENLCGFDYVGINFTAASVKFCGNLEQYLPERGLQYTPAMVAKSLCIRTESRAFSVEFKSDSSVRGRGFIIDFLQRSNSSPGASGRSDCPTVYNGSNIPSQASLATPTASTSTTLQILGFRRII